MNEPSVLDVFKEKMKFWQKKKPDAAGPKKPTQPKVEIPRAEQVHKPFPYLTIVGTLLAILAQTFLEPANRIITYGIILYVGAAAAIIGGIVRKEWLLPSPETFEPKPLSLRVKWIPLVASMPFLLLAFLTFGGNQFTILNTTLWVIGIVLLWSSIWTRTKPRKKFADLIKGLKDFQLKIKISPFAILLILTFILVIFFRFYHLNQTPGEMFSDHAEKLLDVSDVLNGKFSIFFPRNTGREAIQMYLTAAIAKFLNTGLSFISLKIGTALIGLFALPFIYLLGKEIANKWVGWFALILAGVAYWPNVISRVGLRFPLYTAFTAPVLYFLVRGLKRSNRNDLILSGIFLGLGLHGYSPFRFVPFVVVFAFFIFILHPFSRGNRKAAWWNLLLIAVISFVIFLPLFRYFLSDPASFSGRALSRLGSLEQPLPGPALNIFINNLSKASVMFFYDNGEIWVHSIPHRPALDILTAAFFFVGLVLMIIRYVRQRNWFDLFLLISIPLLLMPSVLSLAFPAENPSLNRTAGAVIPVFIVAGFGFYTVISTLWNHFKGWVGKGISAAVCTLVLLGVCSTNFDLVFRQYHDEFLAGAWNTLDIGSVIRGFTQSIGSPDNAYVVPFPYWVDTRLVGINAGFPLKDYALWPDSFNSTLSVAGSKLFIIKAEDSQDIENLQTLYPNGTLFHYADDLPGKDFDILLVTP